MMRLLQAAMAEGVSNISFGELSGNLGAAMYQYSFRIPAYYTLLVRCLPQLWPKLQRHATSVAPI